MEWEWSKGFGKRAAQPHPIYRELPTMGNRLCFLLLSLLESHENKLETGKQISYTVPVCSKRR